MRKSLFVLAATLAVTASAQPAAKPVHRFHKVTDTIYSAIATGAMTTGSNSAIIVNERSEERGLFRGDWRGSRFRLDHLGLGLSETQAQDEDRLES